MLDDADEGLVESNLDKLLTCLRKIYYCYDVNKCNEVDGNSDDHVTMLIRWDAHHPMEHIHGFIQCHYMPPSGGSA